MRQHPRILVAQTSFLGDVILSTPVFAALRRHYPHAHLIALVRPEAAALLSGHPHVDTVLTDDKRGSARGLGSLRVVRMLRQARVDTALALHKSLRTAWILAAAGIPQRIGFRQSAGGFLYHRRVDRDRIRHDVERNLSILAGLDLDPQQFPARPFLACAPAALARTDAVLRAHGVPAGTRLIGVAPGSVWNTKRWTVEGYAALLQALRAEDATPLLLGASSERAYAEAIQRRAGGLGVNLVGHTDLPMLIAAIDRCQVLVTNDSAPMHVAVARGTPVVAIFGPTVLAQGYGPYTDRARVVERTLTCRPCGRHGSAECPIGTHACMRDIAATEVLAAVHELLQQRGDPQASTVAGP